MFDAADAAVEGALAAGAAYADARVTATTTRSLAVQNGSVETIATAEDIGVGVRALIGSAWGFLATDELSTAAGRRAGERAAEIARASWTEYGQVILCESVDEMVAEVEGSEGALPLLAFRAAKLWEARDRERKLIKKIDEALMNLDNEEYGYCEACGVEIGIRRLEARPTATLCIDCKTLDEIREKQMG